MKSTRKVVGFITCIVLLILNSGIVSASEITTGKEIVEDVKVQNPEEFYNISSSDTLKSVTSMTRGASKPTSTWNIANSGQYDFDFSVRAGNSVYSGYNFTGTTSAVLYINAAPTGSYTEAEYTVKIYRNEFGFDDEIGSFVKNTSNDQNYQINLSNLNSSHKYYFRIWKIKFLGT